MLQIVKLSFSYDTTEFFQDFDLVLQPGQNLAVMGESGCGKSTLLELIYGLLEPSAGSILWNKTGVPRPSDVLIPGDSRMQYLPQDYGLMPYTTVGENVAENLSRQEPEASLARVFELLEVVDMSSYKDIKVKNLSGGQKQRVALAKSLAVLPEILLLDEPFSHIDYFRRHSLRQSLFKYLKEKGVTTIVASHDKEDVLGYCDHTLILREGKQLDYRITRLCYEKPMNVYCGSLFGIINKISIDNKTSLIYPSQLIIDPDGDLVVTVINSRYQGRHHLIEALTGNKEIVFFYSDIEMFSGSEVILSISIVL